MEFKVHMVAFMPGDIRPVEVPDEDVPDFAEGLAAGDVRRLNRAIVYSGQNEVNRSSEHVSVSVGDIIEWPEHLAGRPIFWDIGPTGFVEITGDALEGFLEEDRPRAVEAVLGIGLGADPLQSFSTAEKLTVLDLLAGQPVPEDTAASIRKKAQACLAKRDPPEGEDLETGDLFDG